MISLFREVLHRNIYRRNWQISQDLSVPFLLMPGESKEVCFQVDCKEGVDKLLLRVDGYNVELKDILLNR